MKAFCMDTFLRSGSQTETATTSTRIQRLQKSIMPQPAAGRYAQSCVQFVTSRIRTRTLPAEARNRQFDLQVAGPISKIIAPQAVTNHRWHVP